LFKQKAPCYHWHKYTTSSASSVITNQSFELLLWHRFARSNQGEARLLPRRADQTPNRLQVKEAFHVQIETHPVA
jgi:hypothetical protein